MKTIANYNLNNSLINYRVKYYTLLIFLTILCIPSYASYPSWGSWVTSSNSRVSMKLRIPVNIVNNGKISVPANFGMGRTGTITITAGCEAVQYVSIVQEGNPTQNLLYLKRGDPSYWTIPGAAGSQWKEIDTWENSGYSVTTVDFSAVTITSSLLSGYSTVRINGNNGSRPITVAEGQALYEWVLSGGNLLAEIPYTDMVPGVSLFGVQSIMGENGGTYGTSWYFSGAPWIIGPVLGPWGTINNFASECMDYPVLSPNHNFEIDVDVFGYPAIVHKSYGSVYENSKKVIIVFAQGWSHDASHPGNAYQANIYEGDNLAFLTSCIDYFQLGVGTNEIKINMNPIIRISPNPFNSRAILSFTLKETSNVTIQIIDIYGNLLETLLNQNHLAAGEHELEINCDNLSVGLYFVRISSGKTVAVEKLLKGISTRK
jgi:hypothetical protein